MRKVVITGIGVVAPGGNSINGLRHFFSAGHNAITVLDGPLANWSGGCADIDGDGRFSRADFASMDRCSQLAVTAGEAAVMDSGLFASEGLRTAGVFVGCGGGGTQSTEDSLRMLMNSGELRSSALIRSMANAPAAHLSIRLGIEGPSMTYSIACASSAAAIGDGFRAIRDHYLDKALVGGTEAPLTESEISAWAAMRLLAKPKPGETLARCRPFSRNRTGLLLGEGAAFFVLEEETIAKERGARIYAQLCGYGTASDASHITAPNYAGQARAMQAALQDARLNADIVRYLNAHGTATRNGDISETCAIKSLFGEHANEMHISSTKSSHGHLIGAASALELIPTILAVSEGLISPTINYDETDPECDLDFVPNQAREDRGVRFAMSNSFAFGGSNAALVIGQFN